jgi:hypothetical protein
MGYRTGIGRVLAAAVVLGGLAGLAVSPALAVVIVGGDGSGNTSMSSPPTDNGFPGTDPGWDNVGVNSNEAAIYVGQQWVLMAYHSVALLDGNPVSQSVDLAGTVYLTDPTTFHRLYCPSQGPGTPSDLVLLKLTTAPPLPSLTIATASPATNSWVVGIGQGAQNRSAGIVYWNASGGTVSGPAGATYSGYTYDYNPRTMRWGEAQVSGTQSAVSDGYGLTDCFYTTFADNGNANEMQIVRGDSGGGVFSWNGTSWQLSGMIVGNATSTVLGNISNFYGVSTTGNVAVFDNTYSYVADLSQYQSQIVQITPEPSSLALFLAGGAIFWACRRFRARRRG